MEPFGYGSTGQDNFLVGLTHNFAISSPFVSDAGIILSSSDRLRGQDLPKLTCTVLNIDD